MHARRALLDSQKSAVREPHNPQQRPADSWAALGKARGRGYASHDEGEQTLNQLLACMDGIDSKGGKGVVCVAATNRLDVLDDALCRPGRFDRVIHVGKPNCRGREAVLRVHTRAMPLAPDVDLPVLAALAEGFSPAELQGEPGPATCAREGGGGGACRGG